MKKLAFWILSPLEAFMFFTAFMIMNIAFSQQIVSVKDEPRHLPVLQNKFIRIIDARIGQGDTSLFHIHAIPSAFIFLTDLEYDNQPLGQPWSKAVSKKGNAWFSSFEQGPSTHRVSAPIGSRLHAYDIEILSSYGLSRDKVWKPLFADTVFLSDKCAGYRIELNENNREVRFSGRGPMVVVLVSGEGAEASQPQLKTLRKMKAEEYAYLKPDVESSLKLSQGNKAEIILFEIR